MHKIIRVILPLYFIFCLLYLFGCQKQKSAWQGTIEEVDGITIIKNPKEPMYAADVLVLEEELSITDDAGGEEYIFSLIGGIETDASGRIYILDEKQAQVYVFDSRGNYLRTIGKKGQGPGELNWPVALKITSGQQLAVENLWKGINFYSLEGEFIRELPKKETRVNLIDIDSHNNVIGIVSIYDKNDPRIEIIKFDHNLKKLHSLGSLSFQTARLEGFNPFRGSIMFTILPNDNVVCGSPQIYELTIYNPRGDILMKISKNYDPVVITKEVKEQVKKLRPPRGQKLHLPQYYNPYQLFIADDKDHIFVMTYEKAGKDAGFYYDVFGANGKCLVKIPLKNIPYLIKNNKLYTVDSDEEGFSVVKRYHMDWRI